MAVQTRSQDANRRTAASTNTPLATASSTSTPSTIVSSKKVIKAKNKGKHVTFAPIPNTKARIPKSATTAHGNGRRKSVLATAPVTNNAKVSKTSRGLGLLLKRKQPQVVIYKRVAAEAKARLLATMDKDMGKEEDDKVANDEDEVTQDEDLGHEDHVDTESSEDEAFMNMMLTKAVNAYERMN
jgi:hypothetical protein